jgi:1,2-dihydroxy-3-keto-5-methylthiopentene dioxygenase
MATLFNPKTNETITDFALIKKLLSDRGAMIEQWVASKTLQNNSSQDDILDAYIHELKPFMDKNGYATADVIHIHPQTENLMAIREKFIKEHTHSENEIRFFVNGRGLFWFHFDNEEIFCLTCVRGDFISVPKNVRHWFDMAPDYNVSAIRIFSNMEGWVPHYTQSEIHTQYNQIQNQ